MQKETRNNVYTIHRQLQNMLANSLAVIGLSWGLDQKKNGTEPFSHKPHQSWDPMAEEMMDNSLDPVIRYFVPPVPVRKENYEAKEGERSQYTSMVVKKTSSCFSAQRFL